MSRTSAESSTTPAPPLIGAADLARLPCVRRLPGRNRTKADILVRRFDDCEIAVKDYRRCPWWIRQTLGRFLIRRESAAYRAAAGLPGVPHFFGRIGSFALATRWIQARTLAEFPDGTVEPGRFDRLQAILEGMHARGIALADLNHRDVLVDGAGEVWVIDLATAWVAGRRPGRLRRRLFEHFRASDLFALARLRARFVGEDAAGAVASTGASAVAWHRRARRLKWYWDRLRGAERLPPINDHWRF